VWKDFAYQDKALELLNELHQWMLAHVLIWDSAKQIIVLLAVFLGAFWRKNWWRWSRPFPCPRR